MRPGNVQGPRCVDAPPSERQSGARSGAPHDPPASLVAEVYRAEIARFARLIDVLEDRIVREWARVERDGAGWADVAALRELNAGIERRTPTSAGNPRRQLP